MTAHIAARQSARTRGHEAVFLAGAVAVVIMLIWLGVTPDSRSRLPVVSGSGSTGVALVGAHARRTAGFVVVTGTAYSTEQDGMRGVEAVAELLDADGCALEMRSGLVQAPDAPRFARSPFKLILDDPGGGVSVRVWFQPLVRIGCRGHGGQPTSARRL